MTMGVPQIRWAIQGAGRIARTFAGDVPLAPSATLSAIASSDVVRARQLADEFGVAKAHDYAAMLADPEIDAVYIATTHNFHVDQALAALSAGKHVLCEKPIATSVEDCKRLIAGHAGTGLFLGEAMWTWCLPAIEQAKTWVEEGRIGEVRQISAHFGFAAQHSDPRGRLFNPDLAGGALLDLGIYPVALNRLILERGPDRLHAVGKMAETGVDLQVDALCETGAVISHLGCSLAATVSNHAWIAGTAGGIRLPQFWRANRAELYQGRDLIERFDDGRAGHGFEFEIERASQDILAGRTDFSAVPLAASLGFQEDMAAMKVAAGV